MAGVDWRRIAAEVAHRPWPLPDKPWAMTMSWHDLLFMHWPIPAASMRALVPTALSVDTYDGSAWLGVVPFRMTRVGPRGVPPLPWVSAFLELNVRTYVTLEGKGGVYFFSLDAANPLAVWLARRVFHLPYFRAGMRLTRDGGLRRYRSRRRHRGAREAEFDAAYAPTGPVALPDPASLDHWLTERYCLYAVGPDGRPRRLEIHHRPWPLQPATAEVAANGMAACHGIELPPRAPVLHFAERLDVVAWTPERVDGSG